MAYCNKNTDNLWNFDVFEDVLENDKFLNSNHIHPLKQRDISKVIQVLSNCEEISSITVFGSSTEFRCNSHSDIDLFIERDDMKCDVPEECFDVDSELDIHYNKYLGDRLKNVLDEHGVLVYRR